jgi:hypothetical protein
VIAEIAVGVALGLAALGVWRSAWLVAAGWALHAPWDFLLHHDPVPAFVPAWCTALCLGFDLLVAGALALSLAARRAPAVR